MYPQQLILHVHVVGRLKFSIPNVFPCYYAHEKDWLHKATYMYMCYHFCMKYYVCIPEPFGSFADSQYDIHVHVHSVDFISLGSTIMKYWIFCQVTITLWMSSVGTCTSLLTLILKKFSTVGNWYFHLFKWGKITTWPEVQAISAEYERSTKMYGAFWR